VQGILQVPGKKWKELNRQTKKQWWCLDLSKWWCLTVTRTEARSACSKDFFIPDLKLSWEGAKGGCKLMGKSPFFKIIDVNYNMVGHYNNAIMNWIQGLPYSPETTLKIQETRNITKGLATCHFLGLIFPCNKVLMVDPGICSTWYVGSFWSGFLNPKLALYDLRCDIKICNKQPPKEDSVHKNVSPAHIIPKNWKEKHSKHLK